MLAKDQRICLTWVVGADGHVVCRLLATVRVFTLQPQSTYRARDETGWVYLPAYTAPCNHRVHIGVEMKYGEFTPSQLERKLQLCS